MFFSRLWSTASLGHHISTFKVAHNDIWTCYTWFDLHLCWQEVFEARYLKVPQEAEHCSIPQQRVDKGKGDRVGSLSTSVSSESESSSEAEGTSEVVATQLADLKERVGIHMPVTMQNGFWEFTHFSAFYLIFSLMAGFSVDICHGSAEEAYARAPEETKEERQAEKGEKNQRKAYH